MMYMLSEGPHASSSEGHSTVRCDRKQTWKCPLLPYGGLDSDHAGALHNAVGHQSFDSALGNDAAVHAVMEVAVCEADPLGLSVQVLNESEAIYVHRLVKLHELKVLKACVLGALARLLIRSEQHLQAWTPFSWCRGLMACVGTSQALASVQGTTASTSLTIMLSLLSKVSHEILKDLA